MASRAKFADSAAVVARWNWPKPFAAFRVTQYVLVNFRPVVTKKNWRMDCGVAGYDNTFGLPPFLPTRLRFEDYIYRLWVQQEGLAAAHVDSAQNHIRSIRPFPETSTGSQLLRDCGVRAWCGSPTGTAL